MDGDDSTFNFAAGISSGLNLIGGSHNAFIGWVASRSNISTGVAHSCFGQLSGDTITIESGNTCIGQYATPQNELIKQSIAILV